MQNAWFWILYASFIYWCGLFNGDASISDYIVRMIGQLMDN
jgi:hypothetical protein